MERVVPHSLEAERAVLGAVLLSAKAWPVVASMLSAGDFFRKAHEKIFKAMALLFEQDIPIDFVTLYERFKGDTDVTAAYLSALTDGLPISVNVEAYASIVKEKARLRHIIAAATEMASAAYEEQPAAAIADSGVRQVLAGIGTGARHPVTAGEAATRYLSQLETGERRPNATGFVDLDSLIGGVVPGDYVVVAARPSVGKTSLALAIGRHLAKTRDGIVPFFSLEMTLEKISSRLLAWESRVSTSALERGTATESDRNSIELARDRLADLPLMIYDASRSMSEITAWCRRLKEQHAPLTAIVIDYMQLLVPDQPNRKDRQAEVAGLSMAVKQLGRTTGATVIALAQLSRAPEARRDKRPMLSDLRESGSIEQDADLVLMLHRQEIYGATPDNAGVAEVIVAKNRDGPIGMVKLQFDKALAKFSNLAAEEIGV